MNKATQTTENGGLSTIEKVAAGSSAVIIGAGIIFWVIQIRGVMEMLELAYG